MKADEGVELAKGTLPVNTPKAIPATNMEAIIITLVFDLDFSIGISVDAYNEKQALPFQS